MISQNRALAPISFVLLVAVLFLLAACGDNIPTPSAQPDTSTSSTGTTSNAEPTSEQSGEIPGDLPSALATATILASQMPPQNPGLDLSTLDPCSFLTQEEAESVLGPLDWNPTPKFNHIDEESGCAFDPNYEGSQHKTLTVGLIKADRWDYETTQAPPKGKGSLNGVGDQSITWDASMWRTSLILLRDRVIIVLRTEPKDQEQAAQLARMIIAHIP